MNGCLKLRRAQTVDCNNMAHKINSTFLRAQLRVIVNFGQTAYWSYVTRETGSHSAKPKLKKNM
jgi:hypothetical protein